MLHYIHPPKGFRPKASTKVFNQRLQLKENPTMKQTITLSQVSGNWIATFSNPKISTAKGTDTFPTSYTTRTCAEVVQKAIQKMNPDCRVVVSDKIDKASFL